jgi:surfactin synthase thioesterase subunit
MAELKITVGPITASKTATDANAQRWLEGFLRDWCEHEGINYSALTNQQRANLFLTIIANYVKAESYRYWRNEDIKAAVDAVMTPPVEF